MEWGSTQPFGAAVHPRPAPGSEWSLRSVWLAHHDGSLEPFKAASPSIPAPSDQGIQPDDGDDVRPPNAVRLEKINSIVGYAIANAGFSSSQSQRSLPPSAIEYEIVVSEGLNGRYGMCVTATLEYVNPHPGESMVIWMKRAKQYINNARDSELILVDTSVADWADGMWVKIDTDIRYAEEAEAVTKAVIETNSGQTVGRQTSKAALDDVKLGPVGEKGRINLMYQCEDAFSYGEMSLSGTTFVRELVPILVHLPHAPLDNLGGATSVSVTLTGPAGSRSLDLLTNIAAVDDVQRSFPLEPSATLVPVPNTSVTDKAQFAFRTPVLPPVPTKLLFWLSCSHEESNWELVEPESQRSVVTVQAPHPADAQFMRAYLPGLAGGCWLYRCLVMPRVEKVPEDVLHIHTDIVISDASGSTGFSRANLSNRIGTVRSEFNRQEIRRFLLRMQSIPTLRDRGILRPEDVYRAQFCVFDSNVRARWSFDCKVGSITKEFADVLKVFGEPDKADAIACQSAISAFKMQFPANAGMLDAAVDTINKIRDLGPGGATSFMAGADGAKMDYCRDIAKYTSGRKALKTTFINWDTDGGNNCGPCYQSVKALKEESDVVGGFVMGVGAWVDQECASRIAKILGGPCVLNLSFPEDTASDQILRQDLHHWLQALKTIPLEAKLSAGAVQWQAHHGMRHENALDCLALVDADANSENGSPLEFALPDVSDLDHTKPWIKGVRSGSAFTAYVLSRLPTEQLVPRLRVSFGGDAGPAQVNLGQEGLQGVFLAHNWLRVLNGLGQGVKCNKHALATQLKQLLEASLSFNWNLPTPSGATARLGRAKTKNRPPVSETQQPVEPEMELRADTPTQNPAWESVGTFGGKGSGLGMGCFGGPQKRNAAAGLCARGLNSGFAAQPMMMAAPAVGPPPPMGAGTALFGAARSPAWGPSGFSTACAPAEGPLTPRHLLESSCNLSVLKDAVPGGQTACGVTEAVKRLVYLLSQVSQAAAASSTTPAQTGALDPLVAELLGGAPQAATLPLASTWQHTGYGCDACRVIPITGVRYRSLVHVDYDLCASCFASTPVAKQHAWVMLQDPSLPLRHAIRVGQKYWPLLSASSPLPEQLRTANVDTLRVPALVQIASQMYGSLAS